MSNDLFFLRVKWMTKEELKAEFDGPTVEKTPTQIALDAMIDSYVAKGYEITCTDPLTLRRGRAGYQLQNGVLVSL